MAVGAAKDKWDKYNNSKQFVQAHEAGFDAVGVVGALVAGKLLETIVETGKKLGKKSILNAAELVADIVKKRGNIKGIKLLQESKDLASDFFKTNKDLIDDAYKGDFDKWYNDIYTNGLKKTVAPFEAHHVIPIDILKTNDKLNNLLFDLKKADPNFNFDFNGIENGIMIQKKNINLDLNGHGKHNEYSLAISAKVTAIIDATADQQEAFVKIKSLISNTKETLKNEVLLGSKNVNDIRSF